MNKFHVDNSSIPHAQVAHYLAGRCNYLFPG